MRCPARTGFTLVELLVVISIIALLASLLLPAVNAVRDAARGARCLGNLRHLAIACQAYADADEGRFPSMNRRDNANHGGNWYTNMLDDGGFMEVPLWRSQFFGSVADGVWRCPAMPESQVYWGGGYAVLERRTGCAWQWHGAGYSGLGMNRLRMTRPSDRALLTDGERDLTGMWRSSPTISCPVGYPQEWDPAVHGLDYRHASPRHGGGRRCGVAFADGRAEMASWQDLRSNRDDLWSHVGP